MTLTNEPKGFRDLYWCLVLNEPFICQYRDGRFICTTCDWKSETEWPDDAFLAQHRFIGHVAQPEVVK